MFFMGSAYTQFQGFKIVALKTAEHPVLGTNTFTFVDSKDIPESIYISVLIGSNGTGKSELLRLLIYLFRYLHQLGNNPERGEFHEWFELSFLHNGSFYKICNYVEIEDSVTKERSTWDHEYLSEPELLKNGEIIELSNLTSILPSNIIANSIMLTDKYIVPRNNSEQEAYPMYRYLGVRSRPQQASTRYYVRKTVEFIVEQLHSNRFREGVEAIAGFLGMGNNIIVSYKTRYTKTFYTGYIDKDTFADFFEAIRDKYKDSPTQPPFMLSNYDSLKKEKGEVYIDALADYLNQLTKQDGRLKQIYRSSARKLGFNIVDPNSHQQLQNEYDLIEDLRYIGLIHAPEVYFDEDVDLNISQTSSGEFHFFSTMIAMLASIEENSIVFIDEPEISLHPNWQMQYINFFRMLFSNPIYKTCQVLIATHSHFIISDLQGNSSTIIGLKKENNEVQTIPIEYNTYGWSAEEVLYRVFDVRTTRNYYLEMDIRKLLSLISESSNNISEIASILNKLKKVELSEFDPLTEIIKQAEEYINND